MGGEHYGPRDVCVGRSQEMGEAPVVRWGPLCYVGGGGSVVREAHRIRGGGGSSSIFGGPLVVWGGLPVL